MEGTRLGETDSSRWVAGSQVISEAFSKESGSHSVDLRGDEHSLWWAHGEIAQLTTDPPRNF